jgi:hypothetical protein
LPLSFTDSSINPPVTSLSYLVLRYFSPFFPSTLTSTTVLIEVLQHDVFMANSARFSPCSTRLNMFRVFTLRPRIFTKLANNGFSWTDDFMSLEKLWFDHLITELALLFLMKFFLI